MQNGFLSMLLVSILALITCQGDRMSSKTSHDQIFYVGTYTAKGSEGIYVFQLDSDTGKLSPLHTVSAVENPSFLAIDSKNMFLYAVHELNDYQGERTGAVRSFKINRSTWDLTLLNEQPSFGEHPCHVTVTPQGDYVLLANYTNGSISMFPVKDGLLETVSDTAQHVGSGLHANRQKGPHAHSVNLSPDGRFLYAVDLGIDQIKIYNLVAQLGTLTPAEQSYVQTAPGAGPRHFTFHPSGQFAYVINELKSTITAYTVDTEKGLLAEIQTVATLPPDFAGNNTCADIHVTPDGNFLYGSNRGHDSLAFYAINQSTGELTLVGHEFVRGKTPRNFAIDPSGTFLLAANQNSDNIVVFRINPQTGELNYTGYEASVSMPVCIAFVQNM
ncbi:lactonase family protein [candidate division KSB1 bacterium]|nr:lactonase family protein [candidate division KSB1 bacterium]RQW01331.1 MAG: lactonase family protein [candidate division KSB1 bacterium]